MSRNTTLWLVPVVGLLSCQPVDTEFLELELVEDASFDPGEATAPALVAADPHDGPPRLYALPPKVVQVGRVGAKTP